MTIAIYSTVRWDLKYRTLGSKVQNGADTVLFSCNLYATRNIEIVLKVMQDYDKYVTDHI
jgi:hypothetical protein